MEFKGTKEKWKYEVIYGKNRPKITVQIPIRESYNQELILGIIGEDDCTVASCCCQEEHANALLISKAPEMLEKLKECIDILDVKCTDGCVNKTWIDFQNGNGEDIGIEIDRFIKESKQLIKEATEL